MRLELARSSTLRCISIQKSFPSARFQASPVYPSHAVALKALLMINDNFQTVRMKSCKPIEFLKNVEKPWKFLAPMVSNSDEAYRQLAKKYGADLCYTEMVHCKNYNNGKKNSTSNYWYTTGPEDRPLVIQICGNDPDTMLETCLSVQDVCDAIDINFGCPQEIARKGHYGSFLMDDLPLVRNIVSHISSNVQVPLFCKIRIFPSIEQTVEYAKMIEECGCALLVVHGRTREQRGPTSGLASWEHIKAVKNSLSIPVIANGNMIYNSDIAKCIDYTKCDGVMIAEPHLYNPTIFTDGNYRSTDVFREYLGIVKANPKSAEYKHIKSHAFKMLKPILSAKPELLPGLNECFTLEDFLNFIERVESMYLNMELAEDCFRLLPYIRKEAEERS